MKLVSFTGNVEWQALQEIEMASPSTLFLDIPLTEILVKVDPSAVVLFTELKKGDKILDTDLHYFVKPKDLKLTEPGIKTEIIEKAGVIEILMTVDKNG